MNPLADAIAANKIAKPNATHSFFVLTESPFLLGIRKRHSSVGPVDFAAVPRPKNENEKDAVPDFVEKAKIPDANPVAVGKPFELRDAVRSRVFGEGFGLSDQPRSNARFELAKVAPGRVREFDAIGHAVT